MIAGLRETTDYLDHAVTDVVSLDGMPNLKDTRSTDYVDQEVRDERTSGV